MHSLKTQIATKRTIIPKLNSRIIAAIFTCIDLMSKVVDTAEAYPEQDQKDLLNLPLYRAMYFYIVMCSKKPRQI